MTIIPDEQIPAYAVHCKCGCGGLIYVSVDEPDDQSKLSPRALKLHRADTAKEIAKLMRKGFAVERSTVGVVRQSLFGCRKHKAPTPSVSEQTLALL